MALSPMMQEYVKTKKNIRIVSYFTGWEISMKCL